MIILGLKVGFTRVSTLGPCQNCSGSPSAKCSMDIGEAVLACYIGCHDSVETAGSNSFPLQSLLATINFTCRTQIASRPPYSMRPGPVCHQGCRISDIWWWCLQQSLSTVHQPPKPEIPNPLQDLILPEAYMYLIRIPGEDTNLSWVVMGWAIPSKVWFMALFEARAT